MATRIQYRDNVLDLHVPRTALALVAVLLLHGPIDILLTLNSTGLESNPIVNSMGITAWAVAKTFLLTVYTGGYLIAGEHPATWYVMVVGIALGVFAVAGNILSLFILEVGI